MDLFHLSFTLVCFYKAFINTENFSLTDFLISNYAITFDTNVFCFLMLRRNTDYQMTVFYKFTVKCIKNARILLGVRDWNLKYLSQSLLVHILQGAKDLQQQTILLQIGHRQNRQQKTILLFISRHQNRPRSGPGWQPAKVFSWFIKSPWKQATVCTHHRRIED